MNVFENLMADLSERCRVGTDPEFQYPPTYVNESDGLAYCSNCHTPRQIHLDFLGKDTTPWIACNCIKEHYEQEEAMKRRQEEYEYISRLRYDAFPNPTAKHWKFEYDDHQGDMKSMELELMREKSKMLEEENELLRQRLIKLREKNIPEL